ncbi:helix-turn-helix domain-containing protein [Amedibacillus sp. YH-ame10]
MNSAEQYIGSKIREIRMQHHMSQADLARKLNVSDSIISGYERGVRTPSMDILIKLKNIFNVDVSFFFNEEIERNARLTIDVTDLTEDQFLIVAKLIDEFHKSNNKEGK